MVDKQIIDEEAVFNAARAIREPGRRAVYVRNACGGDAGLIERIEALLQVHACQHSFLEEAASSLQLTLDAPEIIDRPGSVIDRYKLLEKIGEGGMGVVYMAEQTEPIRRKVALKIIKLGMDTKSVIARFEAERQALAMMDHPNIAKVLDAGATETGRPYFVMELVQGVSITEYCDQNNLSTKGRLALFVQVCNAVQHAHQKGIIHRDIKPSNVMVTMQDGVPVPKVIDFGIAKATNQKLTEKTLFTRYAHLIGTPAYMSPEQAELSDLDIDTRSDIYSLGVLLYELLTGTTPFSEEELREAGYLEMQRIIREQEPTKPSTKLSTLGETLTDIAKRRSCTPDLLRKAVRGDLDWIVMKALEKDRTRRYEHTAQLLADIRHHVNREPVSAGPPGTWYRTKKLLLRHGRLVTIVAAGATAILAGAIGSTWMYVRAEQARREADAAHAEAQSVADFLANDLLASVYPERAKGTEVTVSYILESASADLQNKLRDNPLAEAKVRDVVGQTYQKMGKYAEAEPHLERAFALRRAQLGAEDPDTLTSLDRLGWLYWFQGRYRDAEPLLVEALETRRRVLGSEHPETLESMVHVGWLRESEGHSAEAVTLGEEVHQVASGVFGEDHRITLEAATLLAMTYLMTLQDAKAEALIPHAYELSRRALGDEDQTTIALMNTRAWLYLRQKQYDEGLRLAERALEISQRVAGEQDVHTILAMSNLGLAYMRQERYEQADQAMTQSAETAKRFLGEEHAMTLCCSLRLGILYRKQRRYDEAGELFLKLLEVSRRVHGEDYHLTNALKYWLELWTEGLARYAGKQETSGDRDGAATTLARLEEVRRALKGNPENSTEVQDE